MPAIRVIDSHTGGEPTRLVLDGGPELGVGPLSDRLQRFRDSFDAYRSAIVNEPRGSEPVVGALLVKPHLADCDFGVIFFNNVGYLGMCGHGTMGMIASLVHANELGAGAVRIDTPVGAVECELQEDGRISVADVVSFRTARRITVNVPGIGPVIGSTFAGRYRWRDRAKGEIVPTITGTAHVTGDAVLRLDPADPLCWGIRA